MINERRKEQSGRNCTSLNYHISDIIHSECSNIPCIIPAGESRDHLVAFITLLDNVIAAVHDAIMILHNLCIEGISNEKD
jgi:hypothetical protein